MSDLAGLFLLAHGLLHLGVWVAPAVPEAPFDPHRSWLFGDFTAASRGLAIVACVLLVLAGILVLGGAGAGPVIAAIGAGLSLLLVVLTFHVWFIAAIGINVAIIAIALAW